MLASFSDTFGAVFSVSVRDCAISYSKASASSSCVAPLLSLTTFCHLLSVKRTSASDFFELESSTVGWDFRLRADSSIWGA